jgi:hypothetical protein
VEIVHGVANVVLVYFLCIFYDIFFPEELDNGNFVVHYFVFVYNEFDIMNVRCKKFICNVLLNFFINEKC